jgi:hypothetical protein
MALISSSIMHNYPFKLVFVVIWWYIALEYMQLFFIQIILRHIFLIHLLNEVRTG